MDVRLIPHKLEGTVHVPASKSMAHRDIICAALSGGTSRISGVTFSKDIHATLAVMKALGAGYEIHDDTITVSGITRPAATAEADCCESGSTLRFLIPVAAALGTETTFIGQGRLPERPITPYLRELPQKGITFAYQNTMPFTISGKLRAGTFSLEGDISSQFITGLLLALPLLDGNSDIVLTSPLQSRPYADMTIGCMADFGVTVTETENGWHIPGNQTYQAHDMTVEGDFSQAAFFYAANAIGNAVTMQNLPEKSLQGDRKIVEILDRMWYNNKEECFIDASDIPDLVPIMAVAASLCPKKVHIFGAERLRLKESDRLETTAALLNGIGGKAEITASGLDITPVSGFTGGTADSAGDHRIAMCAAIAATRASGEILLKGADCVGKSYPAFFEDYQSLGGIANGIHLE